MFKSLGVLITATAICQAPAACSSDAVAAGYVTNLAYLNNYVMFQIVSNGVNSCAPCPPDPGGLSGGSYCWVAASLSTEIAMMLTATTQKLEILGRVNGLTSDCTLYELTVANN